MVQIPQKSPSGHRIVRQEDAELSVARTSRARVTQTMAAVADLVFVEVLLLILLRDSPRMTGTLREEMREAPVTGDIRK